MDDGTDAYRSELRVVSVGLPRWFTHFKTDVTVDGGVALEGAVHPARYDAIYDLRKRRDQHISMRFVDRDGRIVAERGPSDTGHKPLLPGFHRVGVIDPLSAMAAMRHRLLKRRPPPGERFTLPIYDGARRFDAVAQMLNPDEKAKLLRLRLTLVPIAGFKGETSEDGDPDSAPRPLEVAFTDDARALPVSMRVSIAWLPFVVHFDHLCAKLDGCGDEDK